MGKFTVIPQSTFEEMQLDAGVILKKFTPATPTAPADEDIICPTTGGINISCCLLYTSATAIHPTVGEVIFCLHIRT